MLQFKSYSDQRTPHRLPPQKHKNTTKQPKTQENTIIMVTSARCSPVASILMVSKIALCRTIDNDHRNTATNLPFILSTFILHGAAQRARGLNVSFYRYYSCFFSAAASEQSEPTTAVRRLFFCHCLNIFRLVLV